VNGSIAHSPSCSGAAGAPALTVASSCAARRCISEHEAYAEVVCTPLAWWRVPARPHAGGEHRVVRTLTLACVGQQQDDWSKLFSMAFTSSRNAMVLLDSSRRLVDANAAYLKLVGYKRAEVLGRPIYEFVRDGPFASNAEYQEAMAEGKFSGEVNITCADASNVAVQWAAATEVVTGRRLVLVVALSTSQWGPRFRRTITPTREPESLSGREREIVRLVALGNTGPEIASELQISHNTVRTHTRNAMEKIGARSRAHLVAKALGDGLVLN
jgi:PAS domain S-box-containing protein